MLSKTTDTVAFRETVSPPKKRVAQSLACVLLGMFLAALTQTVIAPVMPMIIADLGGFDRYTWAATAFMMAAAVAYPTVGRLSDLWGRRLFFILGTAIFIVGSVLISVSQSMNQLIVFRALQGIGGGTIMNACSVSIADLLPPEKRGGFQGLLALVFGIAVVAGPVLGGFIVDRYSWNLVFLVIALAGVLVLLLVVALFPRLGGSVEDRRVDWSGIVTLTLAAVSILFALSCGGVQYAWHEPEIVGSLVFGLAMAALFLVIESRVPSPIMPLEIYANTVVAFSVILTFLNSAGLYGCILFLPLFSQAVLGASAAGSGKLLVPILLGMIFGAVLSGRLLSRAGGYYRALVLANASLALTGMSLFSTMGVSVTGNALSIALTGLGIGGTLTVCSVAVQNFVSFSLVGATTAASQFFRSVGGLLGIAALGVVMARSFASRLDALVSPEVRATLPPGRFDEIKRDPRALVDPHAADSLRASLMDKSPDGGQMADHLQTSLEVAITGALGDVFTLVTAMVALPVVVALFFRVPAHPVDRGTLSGGPRGARNKNETGRPKDTSKGD